jgi:hypothetical protein
VRLSWPFGLNFITCHKPARPVVHLVTQPVSGIGYRPLWNYLKICNHNITQCAEKYQTPIQAFKKWQQEKPDLFVKRVFNQAGLDTDTRCRRCLPTAGPAINAAPCRYRIRERKRRRALAAGKRRPDAACSRLVISGCCRFALSL